MIEIAYLREEVVLKIMPQEVQETIKEIIDKTYIDCDNAIAEYVNKVVCSNGEAYTNSLILCNNNYAISLIIPLELTPQNLRNYIID
ncbi:hypothetical protein NPD7_2378 [Clostridium sporogenes]|uniref:hypothetical protein n=1 Tax=Clostridium TaxID=1485 RepID=UPI0005F954FD|nr:MULTISPECIES: hypothetical protein [Clostridium]APF28986.1 hypothetical protein NPD7_2378 [Clostridium sporogenes]MDI6918196.1 hypothetical protein [Clostridium botulinum]WMU98404.1 hypothetical protein QA656_03795 [Clostridium botulinum]